MAADNEGAELLSLSSGTPFVNGFYLDSGAIFKIANNDDRAPLLLTPTNVPAMPAPLTTSAWCLIDFIS